MWYFLLFLLTFPAPPALSATAQQEKGLSDLVEGVERSFAHMKDLAADFIQIFEDPLNRKRQESGHLYLMRPRMMRWEYKSPEEKLFVSDGKTVYFYVPADRQRHNVDLNKIFIELILVKMLLGH